MSCHIRQTDSIFMTNFVKFDMSCHIRQTNRIFMTNLISDTLLTHFVCQNYVINVTSSDRIHVLFKLTSKLVSTSVTDFRQFYMSKVNHMNFFVLFSILSHLIFRVTYAKLTAFL